VEGGAELRLAACGAAPSNGKVGCVAFQAERRRAFGYELGLRALIAHLQLAAPTGS
jgi:hypothetical protein